MNLSAILNEFHFIRPWWLLALTLVAIVIGILWRRRGRQSGWRQVVAPHLAQLLVVDSGKASGQWRIWLLPLALSLLILALAGPTWERKPQPVFQLQAGQVIVMDVSQSMLATDVAPNRLTQARYKAMALANEQLDGETGLIAYAGDAYVISPLTSDSASLSNLIRALRPDIMPVQGSYPLAALELADRLLREAGYAEGDIYWFTDGIDTRDQQEITQFVRRHPHRLAILGVGTAQGAPIELADGKLLRDSTGEIVIPKMVPGRLQQFAQLSNGRFTQVRQDQEDILYLSNMEPLSREGSDNEDQQGDAWVDRGPWLLAAALVFMLPLARRGVLLSGMLLISCGALLMPTIAYAQQAPTSPAEQEGLEWHEQLWQTPYQQADEALRNENYDRAAAIAEDPWQRGTANYRRGAYEQALQDFSQVDNAQGYYNQGNTLMQLQRFDEAANVYREALQRDPELSQAQANLELAERLAEQQREQQQQQQQGQGEGQGEQEQQQQQEGDGEPQESQPSGSQSEAQQQQQQQQSGEAEQQPPEGQDAETEAQRAQDAAEQGEPQNQQGMPSAEQLSEEQRQQMENWLNRIEDDPAFLLQRKMELEARRRARERPPQGVDKQW
ncbi:VWA domain-containing protein [Pseudidiomarina insulisalsae]|uniref:VWFA domain-containing protein n=1 Tax=Pseudidiomarina insulisalsae TaxID=575789 RepID=A0A432YEM1_9GAMM|nr:VWA domain-containing protein [Pseudidiomarina insulisalsae]RUO59398.1 hypothetical protein CWI71_08185 [Pseudidiomarina insulisalsae]